MLCDHCAYVTAQILVLAQKSLISIKFGVQRLHELLEGFFVGGDALVRFENLLNSDFTSVGVEICLFDACGLLE